MKKEALENNIRQKSATLIKRKMSRIIALVGVMLWFLPTAFSAVETFNERLEGASIVASSSTPLFSVYDGNYYQMNTTGTLWQSSFRNKSVKNVVRLGINPKVAQTNALTGSLDLKLVFWKWSTTANAFYPTTVSTNLNINYDPNANNPINEIASYSYQDAHRVDVYVTAINGGAGFDVNDVYVSAEIEVERYYNLDNYAVASLGHTDLGNNYVEINWDHKPGAEYYELEWVHISDLTKDLGTYVPASGLTYDYYANSTRITLKDNYYQIPKIFDNGYLIYRVRPIGFTGANFDVRKEGTWTTTAETGTVASHTPTNTITISAQYDTKMNWVHSVTYGDFGERFEGVSYMDGLGRAHQSVGHDTENKQIIVSNVYYDGAGRAVVSDLPTPVPTETMSHQLLFNKVDGTLAPFNYSNMNTDQAGCTMYDEVSTPMSTTSGASQYYSTALGGDGTDARIADAEKFPYARVVYMDDMTNRVKSVSGYGKDLKTGSGHETVYSYSAVSQNELDQLFGAESGYWSHYQKIIVTDPNGQAYVQIQDMAGRTIASYMAGSTPNGQDQIDGNTVVNEVHQILPGNQNSDASMPSVMVSYPEHIFNDGSYIFDYSFTPQMYQTCLNANVCLDCVYDFSFKVVNSCDEVVYEEPIGLIGQDLNTLCGAKPPYTYSKTLALTKGDYMIVKTLSVHQQTISENWCTYINNNTCAPTLASYFNTAYNAEPFTPCNPVAEEQEDTDDCSYYLQLMKNDMTPGGQYAEYSFNLGVIAPLTGTNVHSIFTSGSLGVAWNTPYPTIIYKDANGNDAYVINSSGNSVRPNQLSMQEFLLNFQPSWADALVAFHPEYCFYTACTSNNASNNYDNNMLAINDYTTAKNLGYFKPLNSSQNTAPLSITASNLDPFFQPSGMGASYMTAMSTLMANYNSTGYSMWQYAVYLAAYQGQGGISQVTHWVDNGTNCDYDYIWQIFKGLYQTEKSHFVYQMLHNQPSCSNNHIGVDPNWLNYIPIFGNTALVTDANNTNIDIDGAGSDTGTLPDINYANNQISAQCTTACTEYADEWIATLSGCEQYSALTQIQKDNLKTALVNLCTSGCNSTHPVGASTSPSGQTIDDILVTYFGANYKDGACSGWLITAPPAYQTNAEMQNTLTDPLDICACSEILQAKLDQPNSALNPNGLTVEQLVAFRTGIPLQNVAQMICKCESQYNGIYTSGGQNWLAGANTYLAATNIVVPSNLACGSTSGCASCATIQPMVTAFNNSFPAGANITESENYETMLSNYLNYMLHYNLQPSDYTEFLNKCTASASSPYCTLNPFVNEWAQITNLINYQGKLQTPQASPLNLMTTNIVYKHGKMRYALAGNNYWSSVSGNVLTQYFGTTGNTYSFAVTIPSGSAVTFSNIVAFDMVSSLPSDPTSATTFQVKVKYMNCGQVQEAWLTVTTSNFAVNSCLTSNTSLLLCNQLPENESVCYQPRLNELYQNAMESYLAGLQAQYDSYVSTYKSVCAGAFTSENFKITGPFNTYQYTLFYYDQAGNLTRTVAPSGVNPLTNVSTVNSARVNPNTTYTPSALPSHTKETKYKYNSFNQLVATSNPDQVSTTACSNETKYWYDYYGRIVASQNPVQCADNKYSYVLYDNFGRTKEVGQIDRDLAGGGQIGVISETTIKTKDKGTAFQNWVYSGTRSEVTFTYYDESVSTAIASKFSAGQQQNLRLRIASVLYFDNVTASTNLTTDYVSANHYSYDIHGNVVESLQDVPQLLAVQQDCKSTQYDYELLSGNVNKVEYQKGKRDQMTHEYYYDKMYRLSEVFTSTDGGVHKEREAHYRYFKNGPLARTEIGKHKVQGLDYAYTINGWMKGVNSTTLNSSRDGGKDGNKNFSALFSYQNELVASDVFGYSLGYFADDYKSRGTTNFEADPYSFISGSTKNAFWNAQNDLYNGNIAHSVMAIDGFTTQGYLYRYDQLNRLKSTRTFRAGTLGVDNNWNSAIETIEYQTAYSYDKDGNISTLNRNATTATNINMDQFAYSYYPGTNRLRQVLDNAGTTPAISSDIEPGQGTTNYVYDDLGQLISDAQEGITLTWRKGDKKLLTQIKGNVKMEYVYNPFGQRILKIAKGWTGTQEIPQTTQPWVYTYYGYDANGQVMATYNITNTTSTKTATIDEQMIYGSGRIGLIESGKLIFSNSVALPAMGPVWYNVLGNKRYELTNHLGDANVVITDRKTPNQNYYVYSNDKFVTNTWTSPASVVLGSNQLSVTTNGTNNYITKTVVFPASNSAGNSEEYDLIITADKGTATSLQVSINGGAPVTLSSSSGVFTYGFTFTSNLTTGIPVKIMTSNTSGTYNFIVKNVILTSHNKFSAMTLTRSDFYAFGAEMSTGRSVNSSSYRYGMSGQEKDNEMKGNGNEIDYGYRKYDPRIGRWFSQDPLKAMYPGMSPYNYAGNSSVACKDPNGQYIIFINGYTGNSAVGSCPAQRDYWRGANLDKDEFVSTAKEYFKDDREKYYDGSNDMSSSAEDRMEAGRQFVRDNILNIWEDVQTMSEDEKIHIVTHSMGAAFAEGMIEELMNYPEIAKKIEDVVHFSPCDADDIKISKKSRFIKRTQVSITWDRTLYWADFWNFGEGFFHGENGSRGHRIKGVNRYKLIKVDRHNGEAKNFHKYSLYDYHYDTKTFSYVWEPVKQLDKQEVKDFYFFRLFRGGEMKMEDIQHEKDLPDNWDDKNGGVGPEIPKGSS